MQSLIYLRRNLVYSSFAGRVEIAHSQVWFGVYIEDSFQRYWPVYLSPYHTTYRNFFKMEWELILKYVYEILKTCSVILLSKKVFAPWFHGLQKKCLPRDFQKENNSAPRDFFDHKKSPPRDLRCAKKYPPRCILTGPVSDKFCQLPKSWIMVVPAVPPFCLKLTHVSDKSSDSQVFHLYLK